MFNRKKPGYVLIGCTMAIAKEIQAIDPSIEILGSMEGFN